MSCAVYVLAHYSLIKLLFLVYSYLLPMFATSLFTSLGRKMENADYHCCVRVSNLAGMH